MFVAIRKRADLHIKPFSSEVRTWKAAAKRERETLTDWIRETLNLRAAPAPAAVSPAVSGDQLSLPRVK